MITGWLKRRRCKKEGHYTEYTIYARELMDWSVKISEGYTMSPMYQVSIKCTHCGDCRVFLTTFSAEAFILHNPSWRPWKLEFTNVNSPRELGELYGGVPQKYLKGLKDG